MGDKRRFNLFAKFIKSNFPNAKNIADIAGGKGQLQQALRENGFPLVITFDKRKGRKDRPTMRYQYRYFDGNVKEKFDLLVGMHPDEATDLIILEAGKRKIPFSMVPCCIKPSAKIYWGVYGYKEWMSHLKNMAREIGFKVIETSLPMDGKNIIITGIPTNV